MSEHNHKPFERHIESGEFNINPLIDDGTQVPHHVLHPRLEEWLESLPQPLTKGRWDDELDDMQKRLRHSLAIELLQSGMLDEFAEQLQHIDDETLTLMMQYPITLAMLSQDYFRQNGYPYGWELHDQPHKQLSTKPTRQQKIRKWIKKQLLYLQIWLQNFRPQ